MPLRRGSRTGSAVATDHAHGSQIETWFGPEDEPLFGVVHVPAEQRIRGAVVVCPPVGKEHINTYRGVGLLAQKLRAEGLLVLRFDYYGLGDSAGDQQSPDAIGRYLDSIRIAVEYVRSLGAQHVGLVGLRLGALLALQVEAECGELRSLTLWDPVVDGRKYLREETTLYRLGVGVDREDDPTVSIIGATFDPAAARSLAALKLGDGHSTAATKTLVAVRPERAERKDIRKLITARSAAEITLKRHEQFVNPASFVFDVPTKSIVDLTEWISGTFPVDRTAVDVVPQRSAIVSATATAPPVRETIEYLGPDRLFAIRTAPIGSASPSADAPVVLVTATASEHRIGPARLWVEMARTMAAAGVTAVRFDRRGTGDSGFVADDESTPAYSKAMREDVVVAGRSASNGSSRLLLAGVCSGSWSAAYAANTLRPRALVMISSVEWNLKRTVRVGRAQVEALESATATRAFEVAHKIRARLLAMKELVPYWLYLGSGRIGFAQAPELLLRSLWQKKVATTVMLTPDDHSRFVACRGEQGLRRLRDDGYRGEVMAFAVGDHSLYSRELRRDVSRELLRVVNDEFGVDASSPRSAEHSAASYL